MAECRSRGIAAAVDNANLRFAGQVGIDRYQKLTANFIETLLGECIFRNAAFPGHFDREATRGLICDLMDPADRSWYSRCPATDSFRTVAANCLEEALFCLEQVDDFVDATADAVLERQPRVVGFSASFQQTLASIALARRIKELRPDVVTVLGGASAAAEVTARALATTCGMLDYVFSGEADKAFPEFCAQYIDRDTLPSEAVVSCPVVSDLDTAATPDYTDYFEQVVPLAERSDSSDDLPVALFFEAARGCWWAQRRNCLFCGLNGPEVCYRPKSIPRVLEELRDLRDRYGVKRMFAADTILPPPVAKELLPALVDADLGLELAFESIPAASEIDTAAYSEAGVRHVSAGIESLSTPVLRLLRKRNTALQNLVLLRDCISHGIYVHWNFLVAIPGEKRSDYQAVERLLPFLEHLRPPIIWGPLRVDRFSPLYKEAAELGLRNLRPFAIFGRLFPESAPIEDLAHSFVADYETELLESQELLNGIGSLLQRWRDAWEPAHHEPRLCGTELVEGLWLIEDTRSCAVDRYFVASPEHSRLLWRLMKPVKEDRLEESDRPLLEELLHRGFVAHYEGYFLSLVTAQGPATAPRFLPIA